MYCSDCSNFTGRLEHLCHNLYCGRLEESNSLWVERLLSPLHTGKQFFILNFPIWPRNKSNPNVGQEEKKQFRPLTLSLHAVVEIICVADVRR